MKSFLKKFLNENQIRWLAKIRLILIIFFSRFFLKVLFILPTRIRASIKENLTVKKTLDYPNKEIFLWIDSLSEYYRSFSCKKEPETIQWIEDFINPGEVIFDIGANVGAYSFVINKFTDGKAKVYAFEPSFSTFAQLTRNILLNRCEEMIIPLNIALSERTEMQKFNYSSLTGGAALHALGRSINNKGIEFTPVSSQLVLASRLDDLMNFFNLEKPNHIKLDVDGIELDILKGAEKTLLNSSLKSILVELEPELPSSKSIIEFLTLKGFEIHSHYSHGKNELETSNYLFLKNS